MDKDIVLHWYIHSGCNANPPCTYCFENVNPVYGGDLAPPELNSTENLKEIAKKLQSFNIPKVILGGGEPLLSRGLLEVIDILREGGSSIELHTNGILLYQNPDLVSQLKDKIDAIAIPLDSMDPMVQSQLRAYDVIPIFYDVIQRFLEPKRTKVGIHTVATAVNLESIPELYESIKDMDFDFWKIYEYNAALAHDRFLATSDLSTPQGCNKFLDSYPLLRQLAGLPEEAIRGKVLRSSQFAESVLELEERLKVQKDPRISVVLLDDHPEDYVFMDNRGDVFGYYLKSPDDSRMRVRSGNIFLQDLKQILDVMRANKPLDKQERVRFHAHS